MLPLELFRSRQFASANLLALVTYAALGGVIFLFVAFLQITLGYSADCSNAGGWHYDSTTTPTNSSAIEDRTSASCSPFSKPDATALMW